MRPIVLFQRSGPVPDIAKARGLSALVLLTEDSVSLQLAALLEPELSLDRMPLLVTSRPSVLAYRRARESGKLFVFPQFMDVILHARILVAVLVIALNRGG
jgi:hypothetical protein